MLMSRNNNFGRFFVLPGQFQKIHLKCSIHWISKSFWIIKVNYTLAQKHDAYLNALPRYIIFKLIQTKVIWETAVEKMFATKMFTTRKKWICLYQDVWRFLMFVILTLVGYTCLEISIAVYQCVFGCLQSANVKKVLKATYLNNLPLFPLTVVNVVWNVLND